MDSLGLTAAYFSLLQEWNASYEMFAKSVGLTFASLTVLRAIADNPECTQKEIARCSFLPKQTVNAVITGYLKEGIIWLDEKPGDRRSKLVHFTQKGRRQVNKIIGRLREIESKAMGRLSPQDRLALMRLTNAYVQGCKNALQGE